MTRPRHSRRAAQRQSRSMIVAAERLEERTLFSTYTVTNLADAGTGSLRQAILNANAHAGTDAINFAAGLHGTITLKSQLPVTGSVSIAGPGTSLMTVSGNNVTRVIDITESSTTVSISGLALTKGTSSASGGAILNAGVLTLTNDAITNSAGATGGGIENTGTLNATNCTISGNVAVTNGTNAGGGIENTKTATLTNCTLSNNTASGQVEGRAGYIPSLGGGAISSYGALTLTGCTLSNNAGDLGGGIYSLAGTLSLSNCKLTNNQGGGIESNATKLTLTSCTLSGNAALGNGGGVDSTTGTVTATSCTFSNNSAAADSGGGVYSVGPLTVTNCTLSGNSAPQSGGGLLCANTLVVTNSTFSKNGGGVEGGGIEFSALDADPAFAKMAAITGCTFTGNSTADYGGAILSRGLMTLKSDTLSANSVSYGDGAAGFENLKSATVTNCTFSGNTGSGGSTSILYGAIVNSIQSTLTVISSTFSNNVVHSLGGADGAGIENEGTATLINCTFSGNKSERGGAILNYFNANLTVRDCTIVGNSATTANGAGGIFNEGTLALYNTIVAGNIQGDIILDTVDGGNIKPASAHNIIGTGGAGGLVNGVNGNQVGVSLAALKLSPLGNNGGPTQTMIPLPGSPALGAGSVSLIPAGTTTDQRGVARVVSGKVDIGAVEIQAHTPFSGSPAVFGVLQAENFDKGGQGAGYYNPGNVNRGGLYRPAEGVGIGAIPANDGGGYFVGYTQAGEFLNYTVTVAATGTYTLNFRVASTPAGGKFHMNVDGVNVTGTLSVPNTGNFNTYKIVSKTGVHLTAGTHVLTLMIDSVGSYGAAGNFDWIQAVKT